MNSDEAFRNVLTKFLKLRPTQAEFAGFMEMLATFEKAAKGNRATYTKNLESLSNLLNPVPEDYQFSNEAVFSEMLDD